MSLGAGRLALSIRFFSAAFLSACEACVSVACLFSGACARPLSGNLSGRERLIRSHCGRVPQVAASAYVDPAAVVIGDVTLGEQSSGWAGVVIRGDVHWIRIGARTNIQDGSVLHVMREEYPLAVGDDVTIGHGVILHGCTIELRCLIGMGSIIAAGTLVPERTVVPPGSQFMGHPGRLRRALTPEDQQSIDRYAARYVEYAETYKAEARNI